MRIYTLLICNFSLWKFRHVRCVSVNYDRTAVSCQQVDVGDYAVAAPSSDTVASWCRLVASTASVVSRGADDGTNWCLSQAAGLHVVMQALIFYSFHLVSAIAQSELWSQRLAEAKVWTEVITKSIVNATHWLTLYAWDRLIHQKLSLAEWKSLLCGRLSWLSVSFLLHVKYTVPYRIHFFALPKVNKHTWQCQQVTNEKIMSLRSANWLISAMD